MAYDFDTLVPRFNMGSGKWQALASAGCQEADVVPFSVADMEFRVAPPIEKALHDLVHFGIYGYTFATDDYRRAVCSWMSRRHGWTVQPEWLVQTYGVVPAIILAVHALTDPGDGVIIQTPVYHPFRMAVEGNSRRVVYNPLKIENGRFTMDFSDLRAKAKDPGTKLLLLCSPHNPIGRVWSREELDELGCICLENGVVVFSDEIHFDIVYKPNRHTVFATLSDACQQNCLIGTAASKSFNLAGLSTSNIIIANPDLRAAFTRQVSKDAGMFNNPFGLTATRVAYECGDAWLDELVGYLDGNKRLCETFIRENLPVIKVFDLEGTYLLWLDCRGLGLDKQELERFMNDEAKLFFSEGHVFGSEGTGFERVNIACPRHALQKGLERLHEAVKRRGLA
jgi:cysteine-S-conjugate beta-lyase